MKTKFEEKIEKIREYLKLKEQSTKEQSRIKKELSYTFFFDFEKKDKLRKQLKILQDNSPYLICEYDVHIQIDIEDIYNFLIVIYENCDVNIIVRDVKSTDHKNGSFSNHILVILEFNDKRIEYTIYYYYLDSYIEFYEIIMEDKNFDGYSSEWTIIEYDEEISINGRKYIKNK